MICKCCGKEVILKTREQKNMDFYCRYCSDKHQKKYASPKYINTCMYPKYKISYINAFDRMIIRRLERGLSVNEKWKTGKDVFNWWINN